jgi:sulfite exporter TauE/SafE
MAEKTRTELNYVIAGALLLVIGGWIENLGQNDDMIGLVVAGAVLLVLGVGLLAKGLLQGRR